MFTKLRDYLHTIRTPKISNSEDLTRTMTTEPPSSAGQHGQAQPRRPALIPADAKLNSEDKKDIERRTGAVISRMDGATEPSIQQKSAQNVEGSNGADAQASGRLDADNAKKRKASVAVKKLEAVADVDGGVEKAR